MTSAIGETKMRDFLAERLDIIEPGLVLIEKEHRLKSDLGADGFIDILARDPNRDLVVIELKRSDQAARQALHELEKYVALLAEARGIRVDQLRCILLSTDWHELLVPFARFVGHADFHAVGRRLIPGDDGLPVRTALVDLPDLDAGLDACPLHLYLLYADSEARDKGSEGIVRALSDLGVEDFITLSVDLVDQDDRVLYSHGVCLVEAEFSEPLRDHVRALFPDLCEDEPEGGWWHEQVVQCEAARVAAADEVRVRTPADLRSEGWEVGTISGFGRYSNSSVWSDSELEHVVHADGERHSATFRRRVAVANRPAWLRMRRNLGRTIEGCGSWPETVGALLDELEARPNAQVGVHAYAPADIVLGLEALVRLGSPNYMPELLIEWIDGAETGRVGGRLEWDGMTRVRSTQETLGVVFRDFMEYLLASATGAVRDHEAELASLHGLSYELVEIVNHGNGPGAVERLVAKDGRLSRLPLEDEWVDASAFIAAHRGYLNELAAFFAQNTLRL